MHKFVIYLLYGVLNLIPICPKFPKEGGGPSLEYGNLPWRSAISCKWLLRMMVNWIYIDCNIRNTPKLLNDKRKASCDAEYQDYHTGANKTQFSFASAKVHSNI